MTLAGKGPFKRTHSLQSPLDPEGLLVRTGRAKASLQPDTPTRLAPPGGISFFEQGPLFEFAGNGVFPVAAGNHRGSFRKVMQLQRDRGGGGGGPDATSSRPRSANKHLMFRPQG